MKSPSPTELSAIRHCIDYDYRTGVLRWRVPRRLGDRPGQEAGSWNARQQVTVITIEGRKYAAHHIAWFLRTNRWPTAPLRFADRNPRNLTIANIVGGPRSDRPAAVYMRRYRQRLRDGSIRRDSNEDPAEIARHVSLLPGVEWDPVNRIWHVTPSYRQHPAKSFTTQKAAESFLKTVEEGHLFIAGHPAPPPTHRMDVPAGERHAATLNEFHARFAYDPGSGHFYRRGDGRDYAEPAERRNTRGTWGLSIRNRAYPAHLVAWFMTYGVWPKRKEIRFGAGGPADLRLANLERVGA